MPCLIIMIAKRDGLLWQNSHNPCSLINQYILFDLINQSVVLRFKSVWDTIYVYRWAVNDVINERHLSADFRINFYCLWHRDWIEGRLPLQDFSVLWSPWHPRAWSQETERLLTSTGKQSGLFRCSQTRRSVDKRWALSHPSDVQRFRGSREGEWDSSGSDVRLLRHDWVVMIGFWG